MKPAVKNGLIEPPPVKPAGKIKLVLPEGRRLYEQHIGRSRIAGGVKASTRKRYRTVFDKFSEFAGKHGIVFFDQVDANVLCRYAAYLENLGYAQKTLLNELTTLKVCIRWLIEAGHLVNCARSNYRCGKPKAKGPTAIVQLKCRRLSRIVAKILACIG